MDTLTILRLLMGLTLFGAIYFLLTWFYERRQLKKLTYIELRNLQISEEVSRERRRQSKPLDELLTRFGHQGDSAPLLFGVAILYLVASALLLTVGLSEAMALLIAFPTSVIGTVLLLRNLERKRRDAATSQMLQLIRSAITHLEAGSTPAQAFSKAAVMIGNPLQADVMAALASQVGTSGMGAAFLPLRERYDSPATRLLVSALEVNDLVGAKLVPTLRQAEDIIRRQIELSAEATAELSQAKAEFLGISVIIGLIAMTLLVGAGESAQAAYTSVAGVTLIGFGIGNYALGVWRMLRVLRRAKGGMQ